MYGSEVSDDGRYLMITISKDCDPINKLYYVDLSQKVEKDKDGKRERERERERVCVPFVLLICSFLFFSPLFLNFLQGMVVPVKLIDSFDALYSYITN
jgi:hypothetical protein